MLPALYELGSTLAPRGARLAVRVNGQEIEGIQTSVTLSTDRLSEWSLEVAKGRPEGWDDPLVTLGTPMGDRPVDVGLMIGKSWVVLLAQGMADNAEISLSWDGRESYQGIGREARHQREAVDLNLMPGHGKSYRRMLEMILPDLEMPASDILDTPRYKQVAFTAMSPLAIAAQLLDWTAYRVVAGRNGLRLVDALALGSPRTIQVLGGDAKINPKTDIPTLARVIAYREVIDDRPAESIRAVTTVLPAVEEKGLLELPAISSQAATSGTLTPIRGDISTPLVLLRRIGTIAKSFGDTVVYQKQTTEGWGQQETARFEQATDGTLIPRGGVVVETAGGETSPAWLADSTFGVREIAETWSVYDWLGTEYPADSGDPWEILARFYAAFTPGPGNGYKLGSVSSTRAFHLLEGPVQKYDGASGLTSPINVFVTGDGRGAGDAAFPTRFETIQEVSRTVQVISPAEDSAAKVGKVTTWELQMARQPGGQFAYADGGTSGADIEELRIVRITTETYQQIGAAWQKVTQVDNIGGAAAVRIETVDARPDRERLPIVPDISGNAPVIRRDLIKVEIDTGLTAYGHPYRPEVLNLEGPESLTEAIYAGEVFLKRACGMPLTAAAYAPDAILDPAETVNVEGVTGVLQSASYAQEGGSAPLCRIEALIPWGGL